MCSETDSSMEKESRAKSECSWGGGGAVFTFPEIHPYPSVSHNDSVLIPVAKLKTMLFPCVCVRLTTTNQCPNKDLTYAVIRIIQHFPEPHCPKIKIKFLATTSQVSLGSL